MSRRFAFLLVSGAVLTVIAAASYAAVGPRGTPSAGPRPAGCAYALADDAFAGASSRVRRATPRLWRGLRAPGMAVAVAVRGRVVWAAECGMRIAVAAFASARRRVSGSEASPRR